MTLNSFEDLDVYQLCCELRRQVRMEVRGWPSDERYRLIDQIIRSTRSSCSQIAEGWGRFNTLDNRRFCRIASGSLCETIDHLNTALEEKLVSAPRYTELRELDLKCQEKLKGYMKYLSTSEAKRRSEYFAP